MVLEERMSEMKKQKKNSKKKMQTRAQRIRSMVMMSLLCVMMITGATYAWFTLSNTARVGDMTLTVGDVTGLRIAEDKGSKPTEQEYGNVISLTGKIIGKFLPSTTTNGVSFLEPVYDDLGQVEKTKDATKSLSSKSASSDEGYYYESTFYLKSLGKDATVTLKDGTGLAGNGITKTGQAGTFVVVDTTDNTKVQLGSAAIRISLNDGTNTLIYEPNQNLSDTTGIKATDNSNSTVVASSSIQNASGEFTKQSKGLKLTKGTDTKITMRIWIEGTDAQCVNEISAENLVAQLQFTTENTLTTE